MGRGGLSDLGNHKGYAGYEFDWERGRQYHVRHRVLDAHLGRWARPDPFGYADGANRAAYVAARPIYLVDSSGLMSEAGSCTLGGKGGTCPPPPHSDGLCGVCAARNLSTNSPVVRGGELRSRWRGHTVGAAHVVKCPASSKSRLVSVSNGQTVSARVNFPQAPT
ncbi:MAG: hypothetical protein IPK60_20925 [Sandaracinaceae bacterium]|nr:hypothetical protein [Sandaracinaceae bacterium]